ncbi:hypothetical protein ESCO_002494 [Escovopsis weberi]|uniref:LysM domain-containing protein n=1 Tax=Escovopsis weberi TaxID=150374 RepID=A0A0M9VT20_ESCWE|nr:hypothetical protein ESCO_002494 [Escovopsis weberi]
MPTITEYCSICTGLKDPPLYTSLPNSHTRSLAPSSSSPSSHEHPPPPYDANSTAPPPAAPGDAEKPLPVEDTLHFLDHNHDTIHSLSLRYRVPADALRRHNNISSDYLLLGRKSIQIPGEFYRGESLSARPVEGEDEERRRRIIRRFMSTCKVPDYDVTLFYLEQAAYDLEGAVAAYLDDEAWEREHPHHKRADGERRRQKRTALFWRAR